ncbi:hypothetical protein C5167_019964 [Papaver somniferum]|uniref:Uncharacterized protein n=1 Tax=Papaver somniferum TaxID=3469 RepID=A0A4Y7ITS2_PAPSO|nr:hypothetical protein C5167_019964 [Papaver somniferum]
MIQYAYLASFPISIFMTIEGKALDFKQRRSPRIIELAETEKENKGNAELKRIHDKEMLAFKGVVFCTKQNEIQ